MKTLKTQLEDLRVEYNKSEFNLANYKRGETKKEKEDNLHKINNYDNATKSLDKVIRSQLVNNNKKGIGYNVVPPPPTGLFAPPIIDLSHFGIEKFKEPEFEGYGVKVDKCVSETSSKEIKKTPDAPIIKDCVSDDDEQDKPKPKSEKKTVIPTVKKKEFVKAKQDDKTVRNTFNAAKASACWVWMPKNRVVDHVSKNIIASVTLKRLDDIDAQGRFKWMHRFMGGKSPAKNKKNPEKSAAKAERPRR
ncbi:hypothetical protein Tco_1066221 [Tanacetum coccineum]|uniref:Uncharacterized protein n=1 Tax=Tanacetum coccineum TaxID=301880 RepID=A0ABQ5H9J0_9ASTR